MRNSGSLLIMSATMRVLSMQYNIAVAPALPRAGEFEAGAEAQGGKERRSNSQVSASRQSP